MFIWCVAMLLECIRRYEPGVHRNLAAVAGDWNTPRRDATLAEVYPQLKKISVDFAVMSRPRDRGMRGGRGHAASLAGRGFMAIVR